MIAVTVNEWPVLLIEDSGEVRAFLNSCPHANAPLNEGRIRRGALICTRHGALFDIKSGACIGGAYAALMTFQTRLADGWIEVEAPNDAPDRSLLPVA